MGAYTSAQLFIRLIALGLGMLGGLCQTVWSQVVGMNCGTTRVGEYVYHTECLAWTELFLSFPSGASGEMVSVTLAGAIAGFAAGVGSMWRPRWAAIAFFGLAAVNLALVAGAAATEEQEGIAVGLGALAVAVPLVCGGLLWWRGEYRAPRGPAAGVRHG